MLIRFTLIYHNRKTRPRNQAFRNDNRHTDDDEVQCKNLGIWMAIITTCTWLVFISYFTSVIHNENMRIQREVQKGKLFAQLVIIIIIMLWLIAINNCEIDIL